jgi:hypothetical protein
MKCDSMKRAADYIGKFALTPAALSVRLRVLGIPHVFAPVDIAGRCLICGERPGCPGVHTFEEIQEAARAEKAKAV